MYSVGRAKDKGSHVVMVLLAQSCAGSVEHMAGASVFLLHLQNCQYIAMKPPPSFNCHPKVTPPSNIDEIYTVLMHDHGGTVKL